MNISKMNKILITPAQLHGAVTTPPSKSHTHRLMVAAALSDAPCRIGNAGDSADTQATAACLRALGAGVRREGQDLVVEPIGAAHPAKDRPLLDCGESGTTLRFMTPVAAALCGGVRLTGCGRLAERPMEELLSAMADHGTTASSAQVPLELSGQLRPGRFELPGNVSSQYVSGLLFALPLLEGASEICLTTALSSSGYVAMTIDVLRRSGIVIEETENGYRVPGSQRFHAPRRTRAEGDWSGSAFWLAAGALGGPVMVKGLDPASLHRDRQMIELLRRFGAKVSLEPRGVTVRRGLLRGIVLDLDEIPDLALPLAAVAAHAEGETVFQNCGRLRLKESDRLEAIRTVLAGFGVPTEMQGQDTLCIFGGVSRCQGAKAGEDGADAGKTEAPGREPLSREERGDGTGKIREIDSFRDHRVAMMAALLASAAPGQTVIRDPQCVAKSYPAFFDDYRKLGGAADDI